MGAPAPAWGAEGAESVGARPSAWRGACSAAPRPSSKRVTRTSAFGGGQLPGQPPVIEACGQRRRGAIRAPGRCDAEAPGAASGPPRRPRGARPAARISSSARAASPDRGPAPSIVSIQVAASPSHSDAGSTDPTTQPGGSGRRRRTAERLVGPGVVELGTRDDLVSADSSSGSATTGQQLTVPRPRCRRASCAPVDRRGRGVLGEVAYDEDRDTGGSRPR